MTSLPYFFLLAPTVRSVSYTHLDVYKRQQVFYESGNEEGQALAESIQASIKEQLNNTERSAMAHADAYLLHQISGPAVICETGFLSHSEEEALLTDNEYQWDMAWAIFTGLVEYLNEGSQQETA